MKLTLTAATLLTASIFAGPMDRNYQDSYQYGEQSPHMNQTRIDDRVITPNASPVVRSGVDLFLFADYLYWTAREDGLGYIQSGVTITDDRDVYVRDSTALAPVLTQGKTHYVSPKFDSGFKGGLGFDMGHDGWDLMATYTWFRTKQNGKATNDPNTLGKKLVPIWSFSQASRLQNVSFSFANNKASWTYRLNNIDLSIGRSFFVSPYLILRPHVGLKGTWQKQKYNIKYNDITGTREENDATIATSGYYHIRFDQKYWGVGLRGGLESAYQFNQNFGIYGNFAVATLWGQFDVKRKDHCEDSETSTTGDVSSVTTIPLSLVTNAENNFHSLNGVFELELGLRYDVWFSDNDYRFRIQAGWENQLWLAQNQFKDFSEANALYGNLVFQGLSARIRFDF
ncbi:MAG: hypothetical protein S4CHLAM37_09640 [Chlamydiia bacterium]|nr:hypothetical protein [Chlamydiia bacterium]